jgi:hypothetical protein
MSELGKKYEELIEADARATKEDTLKELATYEKERTRRVSGAEEEPRAIAGPYCYTVHELIDQVERETKFGRDIINSMINLKANLAKEGE